MNKPFIIVLFVLSLLILNGCLKDDALNLQFTSYEPKDINDGLAISNPTDQNVNGELLNDIYNNIYNDENLWSLRSFACFS